jgi:hypothetical protein
MQSPYAPQQQQAYTPPKLKPIQVRGQAPEEPTPLPTNKEIRIPLPKEMGIRIPSPTDLGVGIKTSTSSSELLSWDQIRQRLDRLGATKFQLEKVAQGYRFAFELSSGPIESSGNSENEAIRSALSKAESLVRN